MRADARDFQLAEARDLDEALARVHEGYTPIAGGTDVMVVFAAGKLPAGRFVSIRGIAALRHITVTDEAITFGALATYSDVQAHETVRKELPMLVDAAAQTGGWAIQNRGTLGGNIANASPAADSPPALLAYGAGLELVGPQGRRTIDYATFHTAYKKTLLAPGELIAAITVPRRPRTRHTFRKVGPRRAQAISKLCFAAVLDGDRPMIGLGAVGPIPLRARRTEEMLLRDPSRAGDALAVEIKPIDDVRSTALYRRQVAVNLVAELARNM
jgi:CO/xanthine dehydrogenase FAD-binding subunit